MTSEAILIEARGFRISCIKSAELFSALSILLYKLFNISLMILDS